MVTITLPRTYPFPVNSPSRYSIVFPQFRNELSLHLRQLSSDRLAQSHQLQVRAHRVWDQEVPQKGWSQLTHSGFQVGTATV